MTLRIGTTDHTSTTALQRRLVERGHNPGPVDGLYGLRTAAAVAGFQRGAGLVVDGVAGPVTLGALGLLAPAPEVESAPTTQPTGGRRGTLLLLGHVAEPIPFRAALAGLDVEVRAFVASGLSSAYHALAARLRSGGRVLPGLLRYVGAERPAESYERIVVATWSAPYALVEDLLSHPADAAAVSGWVALDSGYGTPPPSVVDLAARARAGLALYWAGHTDVPTSGYPSSGAYLATVRAIAGEPAGLFRVEHWAHNPEARRAAPDAGAFWRAEHVGALRRGPAFVRTALDALLSSHGGLVEPHPVPPDGESLGERALRFALAELAAGVREEPMGSNDSSRIALYRSGAMRAGRPLRAGPGPWCAYAVSWCAYSAALHDDPQPPHEWRASVAELVSDARASGAWHPAGDGYRPSAGDLAIFGRDGDSPLRGGKGHVAFVESIGEHTVTTIDPNHIDQWARVVRHISEALGWVEYPREA